VTVPRVLAASRWLNVLFADRAVAFGVLTRGWQSGAGVVTLVLIAKRFSPQVQGYYYTFASLLALQSVVELGLYVVLVNVASHQWASLRLDDKGRIVGDPHARSRLISLGRASFRWYAAVSALFVAGVGCAGFLFFSRASDIQLSWQGPWFTLVALTGMVLWALPFNSLLEGCNQVAAVQRFRFSQAILETTALWITILVGGGLWAAPAAAATKLLRDLYLLLIQYRRFFEPFFSSTHTVRINWKVDVWPMQWRLAISGLVNYLAFGLFSPVMFYYHGPAVAGRMGMTLAVVNAWQLIALSWVQPRVPQFGMLVANREFDRLDQIWFKTLRSSVAVAAVGGAMTWVAVYLLHLAEVPLVHRLLTPLPTGLFLVSMVLMQVSQCETAYLRAHREEPIVMMSVVSSMATGLLVWSFGSRFGPIGAAGGYLLVVMGIVIWETFIWLRCRSVWHAEGAPLI